MAWGDKGEAYRPDKCEHEPDDGCMWCCRDCNYDRHLCPNCGTISNHRESPCSPCVDHQTWLCPGCWERWPIERDCLNCEGKSFVPGLFRHPPVDPVTCEVSAADDAILLGELRHCDTPEVWNREDCTAVMNDHGWIDDGSPHGVTVCPPAHAS